MRDALCGRSEVTVSGHGGHEAGLTFGRQPAERPEQLGEVEVVLAGHSLGFFAA